MEILSVTLKNFKSHQDRCFEFQPGTNAICGENGAGKTSILEAIAWTLFNYRGAYKNEDLVRNGSGSAQAIVRLLSSADGRTYEVQRCTSRGYTLYDPQLDQRLPYKHIEDEIIPWLRQHLGVPPGTDLGRLFANTLGVPQGPVTVDFLQPAEKRKPIFDAILNVEEYQQAYRQGLSLEKYAKTEVEKIEALIAQYEERLSDWEIVQQEREQVQGAIAQDETTLKQLQVNLTQLHQEKERLSEQAKQVQSLENQLQQLSSQIEGRQHAIQLLDQSVQQSRDSVQLCETHRAGYEAFRNAEAELQALDQQVKQRQSLLSQRERYDQQLVKGHTQLTRLTLQLEQFTQAQADLDQLTPLIQQQIDLERQQAETHEQLQRLQAGMVERQHLLTQAKTAQTQQAQLAQDIQHIQALETPVQHIPDWEQQRDRLQEQLSRIEAAQQFEAELQHLMSEGKQQRDRHQQDVEEALRVLAEVQKTVPLLASSSFEAAIAAIQAGVDLNTNLLNAIQSILTDLSAQVSAKQLDSKLRQIRQTLDQAYQQRAEFSTLAAKQAQQIELETTLDQLRHRIADLDQQLSQLSQWQQARSHLESALAQLHDPRGRSQLLQHHLQQRDSIQSAYISATEQQALIQSKIDALNQQLTEFAELETRLEHQKQLRQTHQVSYLTYMQHDAEARRLPALDANMQEAIAHLRQLETHQTETQRQLAQLTQDYDPSAWQQIETQYQETRSQADRIEGSLPQQRRFLSELERRIIELQEVADQRDRAQVNLKERSRIKRFISFARKAYKEAGPRITERYVHSISREADRLFRELLNRSNVALEWTRDYEILVQEGAHVRRFINLSGGEQMCAALAVRLALLRVLADVDVAFFDEPTTNMDRPRRKSLAEAIANIRSFRQLFVISHDDTFESVTENIIFVERDA